MLHRTVRTVAIVLFAAMLVVAQPTLGQDGNETANTRSLAMFMDATEGNGSFEEPVYTLVLEGSGSATDVDTGCAPTGGHPKSPVARWSSAPAFDFPVTFLGSVNVSVTLTAAGDAPQPLSQGAVTIGLMLSGGADAQHPIASGERQVQPTAGGQQIPGADLPAGQLPGSTTIELAASDPHTIPAGLPLVMTLTIGCEAGSWGITVGEVPAMQYVIGAPGAPDTDGDGIPDELDDDIDDDTFTNAEESAVGSNPGDATSTPQSESANCPGYTYQEVVDETGDPNSCPVESGFPWLLIVLVLLVVVLLAGGGAGAFLVVNKKIKMTVSHDGFQALEKGQSAEYELTLIATGKKEEEVPVELTLKGVPEDWSASLEPSHMTLLAGEAAEAQTAVLRLTPPPGEEYESEAQVVVTATPTDAEGKTSAMKPGTSVKTKTIVNIGVTPPEGEGKKKKPKKEKKAETEEGAAEAEEEGGKKKAGLGALLKRKKAEETSEEEAEAEAEEKTAETASEPPAAGAAAAEQAAAPAGKPSVAMGKMVHEPADFSAGDDVTTTVTVRNKGDGPVEGLTLSLYVNDQRADQKSVDLGPGDSEEVTFHWTAQPDENRVKLKGSMKGA